MLPMISARLVIAKTQPNRLDNVKVY